jgi:Protein of unknown function (DUF1353)
MRLITTLAAPPQSTRDRKARMISGAAYLLGGGTMKMSRLGRRQALAGLAAFGTTCIMSRGGSYGAAPNDKAAFMRAALAAIAAENKRQADAEEERVAADDRKLAACKKTGQLSDECRRIENERNTHYSIAMTGSIHAFGDWDVFYIAGGPLYWEPNIGQTFKPVIVPLGFVTDLASVPRIFWSLLPRTGRYALAAIVHDYLYWVQDRKRNEADRIFLAAMEDSKVDAATRTAMYQAVRLGGESAWNANTAARARGEKRFLRQTPKDPLISWKDWQKRPGVLSLSPEHQ